MKKQIALFSIGLAIIISANVAAFHPTGTPPQGGWKAGNGLSLGISLAYVYGGGMTHAFAPGLEMSFFKKIRSPITWWGTVGGKMMIADNTIANPFVETGINLLVFNIGMGYVLGIPSTFGRHHMNLFFGCSLPVYTPKRGRLLYIQFYYRPILTFPPSQYPLSHEMGIMFKWLIVFNN